VIVLARLLGEALDQLQALELWRLHVGFDTDFLCLGYDSFDGSASQLFEITVFPCYQAGSGSANESVWQNELHCRRIKVTGAWAHFARDSP
jgi:hypothetical protein